MGQALERRSAVTHNYLAGITFGDWLRLLDEPGNDVDWQYVHRAAFITLTSLMNSFNRRREEKRFGRAIGETTIDRPPLFILGHWRSGTTHLHYLLAKDDDQFAFPNTYQVTNPHTFLLTEEVNSKRFARLVPKKRPMDNMALSFASPQEDELGLAMLSFRSMYLGVSFPRRVDHYDRYLTFAGCTKREIDDFKRAFVWFCRKLTLKFPGRTLLIKSPPHTGRVKLLLEMFPDARFAHIHRNPYEVFQSFRHYYDTAMWYTYLQVPDYAQVEEHILRRYVELHEALERDKVLIPPGRFREMRYDDLDRDPMGETERLYSALALDGFDRFRPKLQAYVDSLKTYEKNKHRTLPDDVKRRVAARWGKWFDLWGYPL